MTPQEQLRQITDALQKAADAKTRARQAAEADSLLGNMGKYFAIALKPLQTAVDEMKRIGSSLGILSSRLNNLEIPKPEIRVDFSTLRLPSPNVTVKPIVDIGQIKLPSEMNVKGWVNLMGYDRSFLTNPFPVQLRDSQGNPVKLFDNLTQIISGGGGGGGGNHVIVDNLSSISITSSGSSSISLVNADGTYYNSDNPLPVSFAASASQPVSQVSGALWSTESHTYAIDATGAWEQVRTNTGVAVGAMRVVQASDSVSSVSIASNIASLDVIQTSGSISSVNVNQINGNTIVVGTGYQDNALRVVNATDAITSVNLTQTLGSATVVGTGYQDNALRVVHATDAVMSVNVVSTITQNVSVTGGTGTVAVVGDLSPGAANVNSPPVRAGGVAVQTNPAAIADGSIVNFSADKLGRQLSRPVQVRELIATAYSSITTGTEVTLITAAAATYLDLIYVMGTNNSDAAVTVDIRSVVAGNIQTSIRIPANGTAGVALPVPIPQDATGNAWTADLPDITGTTVTLSALFSKEV